MTEQLKDKLLDILMHFKTGLDDIEEGSGERQPMQDEIDFALPLVKKLIIADVSVPKGTLPLCKFLQGVSEYEEGQRTHPIERTADQMRTILAATHWCKEIAKRLTK